VARPRRLGPADLGAGTDEAAGDGMAAALGHQPHGDGGRMPAARRQAGEERILRGLFIEMEGLRIELAGERLNLPDIQFIRGVGEARADVEIVEIEPVARVALRCIRHCSPRRDLYAARKWIANLRSASVQTWRGSKPAAAAVAANSSVVNL